MYAVQLDEGKSAKRASMTIIQEPFLETLEKYLDADDDTVIKNFQALRAERRPELDVTDCSKRNREIENKCHC